MILSPEILKQLLAEADHPLGIKELLRLAGLHPGQQTVLKRMLRELVRQGDILKEGKRFVPRMPSRREPDARAREQGGALAWRQAGPESPGRRREGPPQGGDFRKKGPHAGPGGFAARRQDAGGRGKGAGWQGRDAGRDRHAGSKHGGFRGGQGEGPFRRGRFDASDGQDLLEGILHVHRDGFGFVHPLGGEGDNVFLPPHEAQRALDNDRVVVSVSGRPPRLEGRLVRVVQRRRELAVGTYAVKGRYAIVYPTDTSLPGPIRVPLTQMARDGDLVKVQLGIGAQLLDPDRGLHGEVAGSLGKPGSPGAEVLGVAYSQGFSDEFPPEVMVEADHYAVTVSEAEAQGEHRKDLRSLPLITIDGEDARDFDDAVYVEDQADGWRLVVAIADVSHYVREDSALNTEALRRATSVYLPDRVLPMLPERLSNGICSLRPDEDRLCMVADMTFDRRGHRRTYELYPAVMRSAARCTYNEVQDVLDGQDVPHRNAFKPHFERLMSLARALMKMRKERGAIDFDLPEHKVVLGEDGLPLRMDKRERKDSHRLIEECMLAANEAVARFFQDEGLPTVYRFHGEPDPEKLATFAGLAEAYGFKLRVDDGVSSKELDAFISQLQGHPEQRALNQLLLRSMMQAVYTATDVGHYGLAAEYYLHFTSPIRRYPDLLVHRLLKAHWARRGRNPSPSMLEREEEQLEDMSAQCSERERAAMQVEREVVSFYACLMMKDRVGEEFAATVAAITDFGFFVELDEVHVEGLVKAETLGPGAKLDKLTHSLVYANGRRVRVGQKLRVRLTSVNVTAKKIDFEALQFDGEAMLSRAEGAGAQPPRRRQAWMAEAPARGERGGHREHAGRPGRREREAAASRSTQETHAEVSSKGPRGRFSREGRREEAAPHRKEPRFPPQADEAQTPRPSEESPWAKRRTFIRPELPAEQAPPAPVDVPAAAPAPWEAPSTDGSSSPHPGFDRLRALASQRHRGSEGRGAPPHSKPVQKPQGGQGARFPAPRPRVETESDRVFSMEPPAGLSPEVPVAEERRGFEGPAAVPPSREVAEVGSESRARVEPREAAAVPVPAETASTAPANASEAKAKTVPAEAKPSTDKVQTPRAEVTPFAAKPKKATPAATQPTSAANLGRAAKAAAAVKPPMAKEQPPRAEVTSSTAKGKKATPAATQPTSVENLNRAMKAAAAATRPTAKVQTPRAEVMPSTAKAKKATAAAKQSNAAENKAKAKKATAAAKPPKAAENRGTAKARTTAAAGKPPLATPSMPSGKAKATSAAAKLPKSVEKTSSAAAKLPKSAAKTSLATTKPSTRPAKTSSAAAKLPKSAAKTSSAAAKPVTRPANTSVAKAKKPAAAAKSTSAKAKKATAASKPSKAPAAKKAESARAATKTPKTAAAKKRSAPSKKR
ncbi:3'-to-5' exoribonuclease RNase R [Myxococcus hansupus]|uniref:Ribonuclease R n=1 Tax=Pseudomyxococcus hansupus TaxID=1297742 RepID=A0A0H4WSI2_9BACT|nr:ribonuclease R [Myxococcus hansupus]AKQ65779.1 3'-to-5' exoribonuclease RNase R [Myxococcus hansupus]